jgi:hypothetical protein
LFISDILLDFLENEYRIKASQIRQMRLSEQFVIHTIDQRVIRVPLEEIGEHLLPSCGACTDFTSELADISVGGAYPLARMVHRDSANTRRMDFFYQLRYKNNKQHDVRE